MKTVTFSGPDSDTSITDLVNLQYQYPHMEIGVLWSLQRAGQPRYANQEWIEKASDLGLRFSLHLCGKVARDWVENDIVPTIPGNPARIQINCNGMRMIPTWPYGMNELLKKTNRNLEFIIQTCDHIGSYFVGLAIVNGYDAVPLFDKSGGKGIEIANWPKQLPGVKCGYAGGIGPENVVKVIEKVVEIADDYWIDMETRIRVDDAFSLRLITNVLELIR